MIAGILSFIFTVLFLPGIASAATTPRWAFLSVVVFLCLLFIKTTRITLSHILVVLFVLYCGMSLAWTPVIPDGVQALWKGIVLAGLFWLAAEVKSIRPVLIGAALGLTINSGVVIAQTLGWHRLPEIVSPGGLFMNKNMGAEIAVMVLVGVVAERLWWTIPGLLPSVFLPDARGALVALGAVVLAWIGGLFPRAVTIVCALIAASIGGYFILHYDSSVAQRFSIWFDTIAGFGFWGNGIGSFYSEYPHFATRVDTLLERPDHAHNDLLELIYELGLGASIAVAFFVSCYRTRAATERSILLAFFVEGCFSFSLHMPATAALFCFAAGRLAGAGPSLRDDIHAGRNSIRARLVVLSELCNGHRQSEKGGQDIPAGIPHPECPCLPDHGIQTAGSPRFTSHR